MSGICQTAPGAGSTALSQWLAALSQYWSPDAVSRIDTATGWFNNYGGDSNYQQQMAGASLALEGMCASVISIGPPPDSTSQGVWTADLNQMLQDSKSLLASANNGGSPSPVSIDADVDQMSAALNSIWTQEINLNNG